MSDREPDDQSPQQQPDRVPDMGRDMGSDGDVGGVCIPAPRAPLDDQPRIPAPPPDRGLHRPHARDDAGPDRGLDGGLVEPEFRYDQTWKRGKRRYYTGFVERVAGAEGERLREELAAVLRDLLDWAARHDHLNDPDPTHLAETVEGKESDDSKDSGTDTGTDSGEGD